jgi:hypothetical protein
MTRRVTVMLALVASAVLLGGCKFDVAAFDSSCKKIKGTEVRVARDKTCRFRYDQGDFAKYVVKVVRPPMYGDAKGEGKYLTYVAKRGFQGEDRVTIRIERRGVGHMQWETRTVTIKVGPTA